MTSHPAGARRPTLRAVSIAPLLGLAAAGQAAPQSFTEAVDVRVVNVDVYVADKKGRPIEGLTQDDFVVFEDGVEVEISNFIAGTLAAPKPLQRPAAVSTADPDPTMPRLAEDRPPLWVVLYVDNFNLEPAHRTRVLDDLTRFAAGRTGEDVRFLLATYELGLETRTGFARDPSVIAAALAEAGNDSAVGTQEMLEYRSLMKNLQWLLELYERSPVCPDPCACAWQQMIAAWRGYAESASARISVSINSLSELVSSLGGLSGRKALFYLSSGLQQRPGISLLRYLGDLCPHLDHNTTQEMWTYDETASLEELSARANANRVTLYPLDAGGLRADPASSVEFDSARYRPSSLTNQMRTANLQGSLKFLADQTGGRAIINANAPFDDLEAAARDFASYYSLGYSPPHEPDGKTHQIRVELKNRRGAELRFRQSYRDKPLDERLGDRLMASLRFGVEENPLAVSAETGRPVAVENNLFEVPVRVRVPVDRLVNVGEEAGKALVRVFLAAEDTKGRRTPLKEKRIELEPRAGDAPVTDHEVVIAMRLRQGPHRISVGVRDEVGVALSLIRLEVDIDPSDATPTPGEKEATGSAMRR